MIKYKIAFLFIACSFSNTSYAKIVHLKCTSSQVDGRNPNQFYVSLNEDESNLSVSGSGVGVDSGVYNARFSPEYVQWDTEVNAGIPGIPSIFYSHYVSRNNLEYREIKTFGGAKVWRTGACGIYEVNGKF